MLVSKRVICVLAIVGGGVLAGLVPAATTPLYDFSRYKVIVDRQPFGEPPQEAAAPAAPAQPPPPPFTKTLRLCGISNDGGETYVAFVDVAVNPNESYYLRVGGEEKNGISVLRADIASGEVLLKKGSEEQTISMNDSAVSGGARPSAPARTVSAVPASLPVVAPAAAPSVGAAPSAVHARINPPATPGATAAHPAAAASSWAERLRMQREQRLRALAAASAPAAPPSPAVTTASSVETSMTHEERIKKLREYNMELIRARGAKGPPLPIELTPDEDSQLVKEGVLPAQPQ